jgi:purine-nucleoside phosphorylase
VQAAKKVAEAAAYLRRSVTTLPRRAVLLEEGMGGFADEFTGLTVLPQRRIPGFPLPRGADPGGRLLFGRIGAVPTAVVEGRPHLFEGYLPGECGLALRALAEVGAGAAVLVAAGKALHEGLAPGTMLLVSDCLDLTGVAHLKGAPGIPPEGWIEAARLPPEASSLAREAGRATGVRVVEGVAALLHGPVLPTPAARLLLRQFGAEAFTIALAPELAAAAYTRMRTVAFLLVDGVWEKAHREFCSAFLEAFSPSPQEGAPPGTAPGA